MTGETWEVVLFAASGAAGIVLALLASALIGYLDRRGRFSVFGWVDGEDVPEGKLSVYVSNKTRSRAVVREAGVVTNDGRRVAAAPEKGELLRPIPLTIDPGDLTVACVLPLRPADAVKNLAACYVIRDRGRFVVGPIFRRGEAAVLPGQSAR